MRLSIESEANFLSSAFRWETSLFLNPVSSLFEFVEKKMFPSNYFNMVLARNAAFSLHWASRVPFRVDPRADLGNLPLLTPLSISNEFVEKATAFLYFHGDFGRKCNSSPPLTHSRALAVNARDRFLPSESSDRSGELRTSPLTIETSDDELHVTVPHRHPLKQVGWQGT